nr:hypothetical protein [Tanacetum cinerariifolium]
PAIESTSDDVQNKNPSVTKTEASPSTISSKPFIKFVKAADRPTEDKTDKVETVKKPDIRYAEQYRIPSKKSTVRGNQRNWNNLKSQQLEKNEHNIDFHQIVDFVEASHLRYALTINPTVYVSHIRQFWSTARIETTDKGTKILATVDGKPKTIFESSIRRNLKLRDEAGISSLPDAELFENLTLMGYNILPNQKFSFQKATNWVYNFSKMIFDGMVRNVTMGEGSGTPTESHHTPSPEAQQTSPTATSSPSLPPITTATIPTVIPTDTP